MPPIRRRQAPKLQRRGDVAFLASYLDHWALETPDSIATTYLDYDADRNGVERTVSYSELGRWTKVLATRIAAVTEPGDRVALLAPQGAEYGAGFIATLRSHAICVPLFAPDLPGQGDRLQSVLADCSATAVLTTADKRELVETFCADHGICADHVIVIDEYRTGHAGLAADYEFPSPTDLHDVAYLQYTSGSTRAPIGVCLTHANIIENAFQLQAGFDLHYTEATTVSWLPLFHDMGLILGVAAPLVGGFNSVLLDPVAFVLKPSRWLQAIDGRQGVMTAAPNFAFDLIAKRFKTAEHPGLDLSGVIAWINGAEPVLETTLERFAQTFAAHGVTTESVKPTYGLAEATVFVATTPVGESRSTINVDSQHLQRGLASTEIAAGTRPTTLISCGRAIGQHLAIVNPDTGQRLPAGQVGEIWLSGPNIGVGYWNQPEASERLFNAQLQDHGDLPAAAWLRTEDLGVVVDGNLYVTGRIKDLVIIDGRNIYPHDVEFTVEESHEAIAQRRLAAFSVPTGSGEALVIVAERYRGYDASAGVQGVVAAARTAVSREHAVALKDFVLIEPNSIPRTSSGKIARSATRAAYLAGDFPR